jgi:hypothetical protein
LRNLSALSGDCEHSVTSVRNRGREQRDERV